MRKFFIIPALVGSLALGGCNFTAGDSIIKANLDAACAVIDAAQEAFVAIEATIPIEQRYKDLFKAAYDPAKNICLHPETATTMIVVTRVIAAGVKIYAILTQITEAKPAALEAIQ